MANGSFVENDSRFERIFHSSPMGMHLYELNDNDELILIDANPVADDFTGIKNAELIGLTIEEAFPALSNTEFPKRYKLAASDGIPWKTSSFVYKDDQIDGVYDVWAYHISENRVLVQFIEVTGRQQVQAKLEESNKELEQFAYVASHDLQEPLRVVSSYCQLLREKHYVCLDDDDKKYVDYVIDATLRMKTLIKELLDFSRVGRKDKPFEHIDVGDTIKEVMIDYEMAISETGAKIVIEDKMPVIFAISFRIKQLIANLFSNSLKFHGDRPLIIRIGCCDEGNYWLFYIKDNGIGIESQYFDRIFGIFKRLYSREEYPGTGIGLALCKRIVDIHGGKIWADSDVKEGTCMYFTIAKYMGNL